MAFHLYLAELRLISEWKSNVSIPLDLDLRPPGIPREEARQFLREFATYRILKARFPSFPEEPYPPVVKVLGVLVFPQNHLKSLCRLVGDWSVGILTVEELEDKIHDLGDAMTKESRDWLDL